MTETKAQLNGLRIAPRKVRALAGLIKGKPVDAAIDQLRFYVRRGSPALIKLVESAVANAENNGKLDRAALFIKNITVDEGAKLKRYRPKGFGRAAPIEKKTSRVTLLLDSKELPKPAKRTKGKAAETEGAVEEKKSDKKADKKTE